MNLKNLNLTNIYSNLPEFRFGPLFFIFWIGREMLIHVFFEKNKICVLPFVKKKKSSQKIVGTKSKEPLEIFLAKISLRMLQENYSHSMSEKL